MCIAAAVRALHPKRAKVRVMASLQAQVCEGVPGWAIMGARDCLGGVQTHTNLHAHNHTTLLTGAGEPTVQLSRELYKELCYQRHTLMARGLFESSKPPEEASVAEVPTREVCVRCQVVCGAQKRGGNRQ